jgi:hypothetical protein
VLGLGPALVLVQEPVLVRVLVPVLGQRKLPQDR